MNYKTTSLIIIILITIGAVAEFMFDGLKTGLGWGIVALIGWILFAVSKNPPVKEVIIEVDEIAPQHISEQKSEIPGYMKSQEEMAACFNCNYSRDIENRTFVECAKFQKNVYRRNICDEYKS